VFGEFAAQLGRAIERLPRPLFSRWVQIAVDALLAMTSLWLAWQLRFDFNVPLVYRIVMPASALLLAVARPVCLWAVGAYKSIWRYFNLSDALAIALGAITPTAIMLVLRLGWIHTHPKAVLPYTVITLEYGVFLLFAIGLHGLRRLLYEASLSISTPKRTLLIGSLEGLATAVLQISLQPGISVIGLLSPDVRLHGSRINGFTVLESLAALPKLLARGGVDLVLIADVDVEAIGDAVATAMELGVETRLLPSAEHVISGDVRVSRRPKPELAIDHAVPIASRPHPNVIEAFRGRSVLITGAGGSIGSELSRQVSCLPVEQVVLLDQDENSIFKIHSELSAKNGHVVPILADIRDRDRIRAIFNNYSPDIVLHAAAYKHVPLMEHNCSEAVLNNVIGTQVVSEAAIESEAQHLLMISTDKAVDPSSVMGATKRIAELLVQCLANRQSTNITRCACVRFGNVMGSNGSVVPIFLQQIANGGPVTITHADMTRYFMTIPSAVQLVLQATALGSHGEIYMLDMGDPVKITDLARRLIEMSGQRPEEDIEIRFVGTRPGEKLQEQLWNNSADVSRTSFPSVLQIKAPPPTADIESLLHSLVAAALTHDDELTREILMNIPILAQGLAADEMSISRYSGSARRLVAS
jgi:FlaA1/EpsC-like NDP-sugar epimerase